MKSNCLISDDTYQCTHNSNRGREEIFRNHNVPEYIYVINNKEMASLKSKLASLEETTNNYSKLQSNYRTVSNNITSLNKSIVHYRIKLQKLTQKSNNEIDEFNHMNNSLKGKIKDQHTEKRIIDEDAKNMRFHYDTTVNDKGIYEKKLKEKENDINRLNDDISSLRIILKNLEQSKHDDKTAIKRNRQMIEDKNNDCNYKDRLIEEMNKMNNDLEKQSNELIKKNREMNDTIIEKENEIQKTKEEIIDYDKKNNAASRLIKSKGSNIEQITHDLNERIIELNKIEEYNASLERDINMKENEMLIKTNLIQTSQNHINQLKENTELLNNELLIANNDLQIKKERGDSLIKQNQVYSSELENVILNDSEISKQLSDIKAIEEILSKIKSSMYKKQKQLENSIEINCNFLIA